MLKFAVAQLAGAKPFAATHVHDARLVVAKLDQTVHMDKLVATVVESILVCDEKIHLKLALVMASGCS